jgi:hypothetical protein
MWQHFLIFKNEQNIKVKITNYFFKFKEVVPDLKKRILSESK